MDLGKDVLVVLKQEARDLYQDALALCEIEAPVEFRREDGKVQVRCWDFEGLTSWPSLGRAVRVVRTQEVRTVRRQLDDRREELHSEWMWITTLSKTRAPGGRTVEPLGLDGGHCRIRHAPLRSS